MRRLILAALLLVLSVPAQAQSFTDSDRREIERWFRIAHQVVGDEDGHRGKNKHKGAPPGLAKRDSLPPGLAKRDTLPPGLAKRDLPNDLELRLSRLPHGLRRSQVGDDILLIEDATGLIIDILRMANRN